MAEDGALTHRRSPEPARRGTIREIVALDWSGLNLRGAITGTVVLAIVIVLVGAIGEAAVAAALAALFVVADGPADTRRPDGSTALLVVGGALVTWAVSLSADSPISATVSVSAVTLLATLLSLRGQRAATAGVFTLLWAVVALMVGTPDNAVELSISFAVGGGIAALAMWLASRSETTAMEGIGDEDAPESATNAGTDAAAPHIHREAVVRFAIMRALAVGACVWLGYAWFPDHPMWAALTFVMVVRPPPHQTVVVGLARALGTGLGVGLGLAITRLADDRLVYLVAAFVAAAYLMLATSKVNYALSTAFTTTVLLVSVALLDAEAVTAGWQRLLATLLGVGIALLGIVVARAITDPGAQDVPAPTTR